MRRPRIITFDCYGTLIDWNAGIADALGAEASRHGLSIDRTAVLDAYHAAEPRVQSAAYRSYREVLTTLESEIAAELGWPAPSAPGYLADSVSRWPPFPGTNQALSALAAAGFDLGILSNIDDDLLAATRRHFVVEFQLLITAQQVRSYKPAPPHFARALAAVGEDPADMLHIAQSYFHDVRPAEGLGIHTVWVNRLGESIPADGPRPTAEVADLTGAVTWVARRFPPTDD